jgi:LmbE family N-acetylglucosaminyl deacetylase
MPTPDLRAAARALCTSGRLRLLTSVAAALGVACARHAPAAGAPVGSGTLVAVFAHPDDETIVSPALAHYARAGAKVYVVVATDGRKGVSEHAHIPAGDSLAKVRAGEARCSAKALGAQPPILLGFEDAGLAVLSPWPGEPLDRLFERLKTTLADLHPDAVITWGADGGYGHQDHRLVGDVVTQVFQSGALPAGTKLYYPGYAPERVAEAPRWYGMKVYATAPEYLTTRVVYDAQDREAARRALSCHWSQATEAQMTESFAALEHLWNGAVSFQQWRGGTSGSRLF